MGYFLRYKIVTDTLYDCLSLETNVIQAQLLMANMNLDWSILETEEVIVSHFLVIGIRSIPRQHLMNRSRSFMFDFLSSSLKV